MYHFTLSFSSMKAILSLLAVSFLASVAYGGTGYLVFNGRSVWNPTGCYERLDAPLSVETTLIMSPLSTAPQIVGDLHKLLCLDS
jgi:hypothetical protein